MKQFIIITLIINSIFGYAQNYKTAFKAEICECLNTEIKTKRQMRNAFDACFNKTLPNYATQIDAAIQEENVTLKYQKGQQVRAEIKIEFLVGLVYSCDLYFNEIEAERQRQIAAFRSRTYPSDIEEWNQKVASHPTPFSYFQRAQTHFFLGNLKEAETDVLTSLKVNPNGSNGINTRKESFLLAWIYEEQSQYKKAINLYQNCYAGYFDIEVLVFRAMAHKNSGGKSALPIPEIGKLNQTTTNRSVELESSNNKKDRRRIKLDSKNTKIKQPIKQQDSKKTERKESLRELFKTKKRSN